MIVHFLRHASAGVPKGNPQKDSKRGLDKDGIVQCAHVGRALAAMDVHPEALISSPLKRATQTASLVANEIAYEGKLVLDQALLPGARFEAFRDLLARYRKAEEIMVVGHNPSLSQFVSLLVSDRSTDNGVDLKKAAVARVDVDGNSGVLQWLLTPKLARAIYESARRRRSKG